MTQVVSRSGKRYFPKVKGGGFLKNPSDTRTRKAYIERVSRIRIQGGGRRGLDGIEEDNEIAEEQGSTRNAISRL